MNLWYKGSCADGRNDHEVLCETSYETKSYLPG